MAFRSISTIDLAAASISVPPPAGIVDDDTLIAFAISDSQGTAFTWPAGFVEIAGSPLTCSADSQRVGVATKKAAGEAGNYVLTQGGTDEIIGGVICHSGRDVSLYLHRIASGNQNVAQASPWSITSGAFSGGNTTGICDIVFIAGSDVTSLSDAVHAAPGGMTLRADIRDTRTGSAFIQGMVATLDGSASGDTGVYTGTGTAVGVTSGWSVFVIGLLAAAGGGGGGVSPMFRGSRG